MLNIALISLMTALSITSSANTQVLSERYYTVAATVTECNTEDNIICLSDSTGENWLVEDVTGYSLNDTCTMVLYDNNTTSIYDDEVIILIK